MSQLELDNEPSQAAPLAHNINEPSRPELNRAELARYPAIIGALLVAGRGNRITIGVGLGRPLKNGGPAGLPTGITTLIRLGLVLCFS